MKYIAMEQIERDGKKMKNRKRNRYLFVIFNLNMEEEFRCATSNMDAIGDFLLDYNVERKK